MRPRVNEPDELVDPQPLRALLVEDSRLDVELLRVQLERAYPNVELQVLRDEAAFCEALASRSLSR